PGAVGRVRARRPGAHGGRPGRAGAQGGHEPDPAHAGAHPERAPGPRTTPGERAAHRHLLLVRPGTTYHLAALADGAARRVAECKRRHPVHVDHRRTIAISVSPD